ncbi:hypothetical protein ACEPAI_7287 [Sanghuangporus weigelae]
MARRPPSNDSYDSNPDNDVESSNNHTRGPGGPGADLLRVPTPRPATPAPTRPPRDSVVRQSLHSLTVPNGGAYGVPGGFEVANGIPRRSFIPYSEFPDHGMPMSRAPTRPPTRYPGQHYPDHLQNASSYVDLDVEENMEIDPNYGRPDVNDEEFAMRGDRRQRPSRLRRFADALLKPFRALRSAFRIPKFLKRRRSITTQPVSVAASSGFHIRDRTPANSSIRQIYSREGAEQEREPENVTMLFPEAMTAPQTMIETNTEHGRGPRSSGGMDSAHGHSVTHHSHVSPQSLSHRSDHSLRDTMKPNGDAVRSSGTTRTRTSRSTRTSFSALSPSRFARARAPKEGSSHGRSSRTLSSISHCSALLHQFTLLFRALRALYHLPWVADPPRRIAVDFIPALSSRSKYCVHRGPPQVPPSVVIAAAAAKNMEPSEGKSWYRPSPQQMEKQLKRGKGTSRHQHGHSHSHRSLANAYQTLFPDEARHRYRDGQQLYVYNHNLPTHMPPPFPQPQTSGPYGPPTPGPFYIVPGGPPPQPLPAPGGNGNGNGNGNRNGPRAPPPARPPSVLSFAVRPGARPVQNGGPSQPGQPASQAQSPDPNAARNDLQRPPPAAQPMYMLVQAPPGLAGPPPHHLPPNYASNVPVYPYPYSPPWTPPQRI